MARDWTVYLAADLAPRAARRQLHYETVSEEDGRSRRRVLFGDSETADAGEDEAMPSDGDGQSDDEADDGSEDDDEDGESDEEMEEEELASGGGVAVPLGERLARLAAPEEESEESDSESGEEEESGALRTTVVPPRQNARQLHRLIYGTGERSRPATAMWGNYGKYWG